MVSFRFLCVYASQYQHFGVLKNPRKDATALYDELTRLGGEGTLVGDPATGEDFREVVLDFKTSLPDDTETVVFYYAGHAFQKEDERGNASNYLLPCKTNKLVSAKQAVRESVGTDWIQDVLDVGSYRSRNKRVTIFLFDCCRNELPELRGLFGNTRNSTSSQGLALMEASEGHVVMFSTAPGRPALDGLPGDENSPFMRVFLQYVGTPNKCVTSVLRTVKAKVREVTEGRQVPFLHDVLDGDHVLVVKTDSTKEKLERAEAEKKEAEVEKKRAEAEKKEAEVRLAAMEKRMRELEAGKPPPSAPSSSNSAPSPQPAVPPTAPTPAPPSKKKPQEKATTTVEEWRQLEADFRNDSDLAEFAGELRTATKLNLANNWLEAAQVTLIARLLGYSSTLLELHLYGTSIGPKGATAIADALSNSSTLLELDLCHNSVGPTGATALAGALENSSTLLEKLYLYDNSIDDAGATALAGALANSSTLLKLDLHYNSVGDTGATALAGALANSSTLLEMFNLRYNKIDQSGKNALQAAFQDKKCRLLL